jgi:type VI secretion system protein ImpA
VFRAEELLNPIKPEAPAGQNLRYEPIYDQIAEARSEEDATLPVGQWARQTKRADYQLVLSLSREALATRSKDLWLAAWLGEAEVKLEGLSSLPSVLGLLLGLQEHFWDTLYPEVEDGDLGLRAAPLQWAMEHYSDLIYELPVVAQSIHYRDYKAVRTPGVGGVAAPAVVEALDAALAATGKAFYVLAENQLIAARDSLERLYLFCDEKYGDDGPSFVKSRTALDEVLNLVSSLLRVKRESDPDPIEPPSEQVSVAAAEYSSQPVAQQEVEVAQIPEQTPVVASVAPASAEPVMQQQKEAPPPVLVTANAEMQSWEQAIEQIRRCAMYLSKEKPAHPAAYLLLGALHYAEEKANGGGLLRQPPSTELRLSLKRSSLEKSSQLLEESLHALSQEGAGGWLDLHRYVWLASREAGYQNVAESVSDIVRILFGRDSSIAEAMFEDDTPIASRETKQWIETEILPKEESEQESQEAVEPKALEPLPEPEHRPAVPVVEEALDVLAKAEALAASGDVVGSIQTLMQDAATSSARRVSFQRRLQAARLCMARSQKMIASRILQQLLIEVDEHRLELWEGAQLVGEVIALLWQSLDANEDQEGERKALLTRLCRIDPARALGLELQI